VDDYLFMSHFVNSRGKERQLFLYWCGDAFALLFRCDSFCVCPEGKGYHRVCVNMRRMGHELGFI
jgi:hypothetical protein